MVNNDEKKARIRICRDPVEEETVEDLAAAHAAVDLAAEAADLAEARAADSEVLAATATVDREAAFTAVRFLAAAFTDPDTIITATATEEDVSADCLAS